MTANMIETVDEASGPPQFPDFPPRYDMRPSRYLHQHGVVAYLQYYFRQNGAERAGDERYAGNA